MNERPNILLIVVDQQRYDCLGYSERYPIQTPRIDALARAGTWFSQAYTPIPVCCPARQAFLAGRRPETFGALWNYDIGLPIPALEPTEYVWPRDLQAAGYQAGYVGKWHVHPRYGPTAYGFDDYLPQSRYDAFRQEAYPEVEYTQAYFGEPDPIPLEDSRTHWLADRAIELMRNYAARDAPWHLRLDLTEPHLPCRPAGRFARMYDPQTVPRWGSFAERFEDKPYIQRQQLLNWGIEDYRWEDWAPIVARYYGIISQTDDAIGRMLDALDALGAAGNTVVIYTTDHGDLCGGHRMMDKHYVLYDDVVRVPLVIRWPGRVAPGLRSDAFVYNFLDLPPTILEAAGLPRGGARQGRSLLPLLTGEAVPDWRDAVVSTYNGLQFGLYTQRMIRTTRWKYVWNTTDVDELYDLEEDPDELTNRTHEPGHEELLRELRTRLYHELDAAGDTLVRNSWMRHQLLAGKKL